MCPLKFLKGKRGTESHDVKTSPATQALFTHEPCKGPRWAYGTSDGKVAHQALNTVPRPLRVTNFRCGTESLLTCEALTSLAKVAKPAARPIHLLLAAPRRRITSRHTVRGPLTHLPAATCAAGGMVYISDPTAAVSAAPKVSLQHKGSEPHPVPWPMAHRHPAG